MVLNRPFEWLTAGHDAAQSGMGVGDVPLAQRHQQVVLRRTGPDQHDVAAPHVTFAAEYPAKASSVCEFQ